MQKACMEGELKCHAEATSVILHICKETLVALMNTWRTIPQKIKEIEEDSILSDNKKSLFVSLLLARLEEVIHLLCYA